MDLLERLEVSKEEQRSIAKTVGRVQSIGEFFATVVEGTKSLDFVEALAKASPFAEAIGSSLADAIPVVKFVAGMFRKLTGLTDPHKLGLLAFTTAYEQSLVQAVHVVGSPATAIAEPKVLASRLRGMSDAMPDAALDFTRVSFADALLHPFIAHADAILLEGAAGVGYDEQQRRQLQNEVHQRFVVHLKTLLSHGDTREKFAPFRDLLQLDTTERAAIAALMDHAQYQRALFEEMPVFGKEAFALRHVYVDMDCGVMDWGALRDRVPAGERPLDPFDEKVGGRQKLGTTVLDLIGDPKFRDAIVVQGVAGAGKSAFTQWLSAELVRQGLRPIRVLLRDIRLERNRPVAEALAEAIRYGDDGQQGLTSYPRPDDPFLKRDIFKQRIRFRNADICPYVLILDGWDEISVSVAEGFKIRLNRMLEQIRSEFLMNRDVPVRVILTGRPSAEVAESAFLHKSTPILTVRPFTPDDLDAFFARTVAAVKERPLPHVTGTGWPQVSAKKFAGVAKRYREAAQEEASQRANEHLNILGLPLLALLAMRVLAETRAGDEEAVLENPTTLYRNIVDLTSGSAGKWSEAGEATDAQFRLSGASLRDLLRRTAAAMTVTGNENISHTELELRLDLPERELERAVEDGTRDNPLSQLMISYYFKGGHEDLGCEFLHKSFREYLYAEAIVELLKESWRTTELPRSPRAVYWKDFDEADARHGFSREFSRMVSAQWLQPEVCRFVGDLLEWEIQRAAGRHTETALPSAQPTETLPLERWAVVRDALADLWDWWCEGAHLRPQPVLSKQKLAEFPNPPFAQELIEHAAPLDRKPRVLPAPRRTTAVDAHLGDSLCRLTARVHFEVARAEGWLDGPEEELNPEELWTLAEREGLQEHPAQTVVSSKGKEHRMFAPTKKVPAFWSNYAARINGAGWRSTGAFPSGCDLRGIDMRRASIASFPYMVNWSYANVSELHGEYGFFAACSFRFANAALAGFQGTTLLECDFHAAIAAESSWTSARIMRCQMTGADLENASFADAAISSVKFRGATFRRTLFYYARLDWRNFQGAQGTVVRKLHGNEIDVSSLYEAAMREPQDD